MCAWNPTTTDLAKVPATETGRRTNANIFKESFLNRLDEPTLSSLISGGPLLTPDLKVSRCGLH